MRSLYTDFTLLYNFDHDQKHPAYPDFVMAMVGMEYGREALNDAWTWFKAGWYDGKREGVQVGKNAR